MFRVVRARSMAQCASVWAVVFDLALAREPRANDSQFVEGRLGLGEGNDSDREINRFNPF